MSWHHFHIALYKEAVYDTLITILSWLQHLKKPLLAVLTEQQISERYKSMYNFSKKLARLGRLMRILYPKSSTSLPRNKLTGKKETAYVNVDFQDQVWIIRINLKFILKFSLKSHVQTRLRFFSNCISRNKLSLFSSKLSFHSLFDLM